MALRIRRVVNNFEPYLRVSMCATTDKCANGTWVRAQGQTKTNGAKTKSQAKPVQVNVNVTHTHIHTHIFYSRLTSTTRLRRVLWLIWQLPPITLKRWVHEVREEYLSCKEYERNIYLIYTYIGADVCNTIKNAKVSANVLDFCISSAYWETLL